MRLSLICSVASVFLATSALAQSEGEFPATLKGHAVLPAQTFIDAPTDAPDDLKTSGKYTTGRRVDALGSVMGKSYERPTGVSLPFKGQPLQGHSGIKVMSDGSFWVITDNGMGSRYNSADSMLYLNRHKIDWTTGKIERQETVFLHDPDKKVPFRIVHEDTAKRYLTGADFDTEGVQIIGDTFWIGDEFGPYVLKADRTGKVLAVFEIAGSFLACLVGGKADGDLAGMPASALAVLPATTHVGWAPPFHGILARTHLLVAMINEFLDAPLDDDSDRLQ